MPGQANEDGEYPCIFRVLEYKFCNCCRLIIAVSMKGEYFARINLTLHSGKLNTSL